MNLNYSGKTIVVTGGASGIGAATARLFYDEGATVVLLDIDGRGQALADSFGGRGRFMRCDVGNGTAVQQTFAALEYHYPTLDGLVNNAGIQTHGSVTGTTEDDWNRTLTVNLTSAFLCSKYAMPALLRADKPVIINVSSIQALVCEAGVAAYASSKAALLGLTRSIAVDYAPRLRCVAVCPGAVDTPMLRADRTRPDLDAATDPVAIVGETQAIHLLNRIAEPDEIARFIVFLASEQAGFATGQYFRVDGGIGVKISVQ